MKTFNIILTCSFLFTCFAANAQQNNNRYFERSIATDTLKRNGGWHKSAVSIHLPFAFGTFSHTHIAGAGADYSIEFNKENNFFHPAFITGITYYLGKKETIPGYNYKYPGFTFIHLMGGVHSWLNDFNVRILAGPALGLYNDNTRFNIAGRLEVNYWIKARLLIGPVLNMMLEPGTSSLWSAGIRGTFAL